jgi:hypothetical protein
MKYLLGLILAFSMISPTFAEIKEFSPVKVIVDTERGIVLREPRQMDYDNYKDVFKLEKPRSLKDLILGRKSCGGGCGA